MVAPVVVGAALLAAGTISKILGKDTDYPTTFGNIQIRNGVAVVNGPVQVLDKGSKADGQAITQAAADYLNEQIHSMQLTDEQLANLNTQNITVGVMAGDLKGAVNKGGFFFGTMDGGNQFLSGIKGSDQGFRDPDQALTNLSKYVLGNAVAGTQDQEVIKRVNEVIPTLEAQDRGLDHIPIPEKFNQSNPWTVGGKIAQFAGVAIMGYAAAQALTAPSLAAGTGGSVATGASAVATPIDAALASATGTSIGNATATGALALHSPVAAGGISGALTSATTGAATTGVLNESMKKLGEKGVEKLVTKSASKFLEIGKRGYAEGNAPAVAQSAPRRPGDYDVSGINLGVNPGNVPLKTLAGNEVYGRSGVLNRASMT